MFKIPNTLYSLYSSRSVRLLRLAAKVTSMASKCEFDSQRTLAAGFRCSYGFPEAELIEFDGKHWCPLHLPIRNSKGENSPKATWDKATVEEFNRTIHQSMEDELWGTNLCGVVFPGDISFKGKALKALQAESAVFAGNADFSGVTFGGDANFKNAKFLASTNFKNAIFTGDANFEDAEFCTIRTIEFDSATFNRAAQFLKARFIGDDSYSSFHKVTFYGDVVFKKAEFEGDADFTDATFSSKKADGDQAAAAGGEEGGRCAGDPINFQQAQFRGGITKFTSAKFDRRRAEFHEAIFCRVLCFEKTEFSDASFWNAAFCSKNANFHQAKFHSDVDFSSDKAFVTQAEEASKKYPSDCFNESDFSDAEFDGPAKFTNRKFLNTTDFSGGFFRVAPAFYGCTLHQGTSFEGRRFCDFKGKNSELGAAKAYRTLKVAMEAARDRNEEARFYALEQKSMREAKQGSRSERLFSLMYELVSDYGRSTTRPLVWLVGSYVFFLGLYEDYFWLFPEHLKRNILRLSFEPIFQPFQPFRSNVGPCLGLDLIMALHSLITLSLVAIFLLALRRRFKLD